MLRPHLGPIMGLFPGVEGELRVDLVVTAWTGEIFDDARFLQGSAMERLAAGDVRDAADKAWCATKRATDALILARMG